MIVKEQTRTSPQNLSVFFGGDSGVIVRYIPSASYGQRSLTKKFMSIEVYFHLKYFKILKYNLPYGCILYFC